MRQEDDPDDIPWYAFLTSIFGTTDPALITVTIIRGLLRVAALQARLSKSVAASLLPLPLREDRAAKRIDGGGGRRSYPEIASSARPRVRGPNPPITTTTISIATAMKPNTAVVPPNPRKNAMARPESAADSRLQE